MPRFFCGTGVDDTTLSGTTRTTVSGDTVETARVKVGPSLWFAVTLFPLPGDYPAPRAVLTGHDHEVVCVSVCAELGLVISGAKGQCVPYVGLCRQILHLDLLHTVMRTVNIEYHFFFLNYMIRY